MGPAGQLQVVPRQGADNPIHDEGGDRPVEQFLVGVDKVLGTIQPQFLAAKPDQVEIDRGLDLGLVQNARNFQ